MLAIRGSRMRLFPALLLALIPIGSTTAEACETPVYRYAMYRWRPAPYELYLMHDGSIDESSQRLLDRLNDGARDERRPANVVAFPVDLSDAGALDRLPADVRRAWREQQDPPTPAWLITSPVGIHVHTGPLDPGSVAELIESPLRQKLAGELASGKATVLLLLKGSDERQNEVVRTLLRQLVADVRAGQVRLGEPPDGFEPAPDPSDGPTPSEKAGTPDESPAADPQPADQQPADQQPADQQPADQQPAGTQPVGDVAGPGNPDAAGGPAVAGRKPPVEISFLELDRDDPREQWLVRMLLAVESDLRDFDDPMVFPVYGRARALPPYLGKGISRPNLLEVLDYITGACSCTVKEQNPGVDLLVPFDWETAAAALAEKFGAEEGNEGQLGGDTFFPELIVPGSAELTVPGAAELTVPGSAELTGPGSAELTGPGPATAAAEPARAESVPDQTAHNAEGASLNATDRPQSTPRASGGDPVQAAAGGRAVRETPGAPQGDPRGSVARHESLDLAHGELTEPSGNPAASGFLAIALGLVVVVGLLFAATFFVLRPR